jgi:hypothetical protein
MTSYFLESGVDKATQPHYSGVVKYQRIHRWACGTMFVTFGPNLDN